MKEFNPNATCSKCGHDDIKDEYNSEFVPTETGLIMGAEHVPEYIKRTCKNCGYSWNEAPLDRGPIDVETMQDIADDFIKRNAVKSAPVLEVGDKITVKDHPDVKPNIICYVTEIREGGQIGFKPSTTHFLGNESVAECVKLFEKGPKVMTFKGVVPQRYVSDGLVLSNIAPFSWDRDNAKAYILTMVEDKP